MILAGLGLLTTSIAGVERPARQSGHALERVEVHRDGDFVVFEAKANGTSTPTVRGNGFSSYGAVSLRESYTIRLVETPGVERLRRDLDAIAATMRDVIGQRVVVEPGFVAPAASMAAGHIDVRVGATSPCSGSWLGCASPTVVDGEIRSAQVWIHPRLLDRPAAAISNGVRHEMGHAFGLGHYDAPWEGRTQTMHSTSFDAEHFHSGDLNGLRSVAVHADPPQQPVPTTAPPRLRVSVTSPDPVGVVDEVAATGLGIVLRGHAVDPDSDDPIGVLITMDDQPFELLASRLDAHGVPNGFEVVWSVAPGTHHVCVIARNVGPGTDTPLGCHDVVVTPSGVGQLGLQTL